VITRPSRVQDNQVSFVWAPGITIKELIYLPKSYANLMQDKPQIGLRFATRSFLDGRPGRITIEGKDEGFYKPLPWLDEWAQSGTIRLPSGVADYESVDKLAEKVRAVIHRYFDCDSTFESVAVLYALMTWQYEQFDAVPYLRFLGDAETGKSRGTDTIGALCYHPLSLVGSVTPPVLYRFIEAAGGTMLIDEADFSDTEIGAEITKVLNAGYQQRGAVARLHKDENEDWTPRRYGVYGPKIINGRKRFRDEAFETRCLSYIPLATSRSDIPVQLPPAFGQEATEIQGQLLKWRLDTLETLQPSAEHVPGISRRMNQIILPLLTVCDLMSPQVRNRYRSDLLRFARQADEQKQEVRAESLYGAIVRVLSWFSRTRPNDPPTCKEVADEVAEREAENMPDLKLSPEKVGHMVRNLGFKKKRERHGSVILIDERRLQGLEERYGVQPRTAVPQRPKPLVQEPPAAPTPGPEGSAAQTVTKPSPTVTQPSSKM